MPPARLVNYNKAITAGRPQAFDSRRTGVLLCDRNTEYGSRNTAEEKQSMDALQKYALWLESEEIDPADKEELRKIKDNPDEIHDRFYKDLEFGTGGMRGLIGAGTNRMNIYTVRKATQGLAAAVLKDGGAGRGVAIAYDSRRLSKEFAGEAALCLCANGIKAYVFDEPRPTPVLSFAVRELQCVAGIVITASHNPPEYNGYKVYWEDGAQITRPKDEEIIGFVNAVTDFSRMKTMDRAEAEARGLYIAVGAQIDALYMAALKKSVQNPGAIKEQADALRIVFSPLHGAGGKPVRRILTELGFRNVRVVPEQAEPDGRFPTVRCPNPEDPDALALALKLAEKTDADIVLVTDPDADRLGVSVKDAGSGYVNLNGNMTGALLCEYVLEQKKKRGLLPPNGAVVTTIVSTKMAKAITDYYGVRLIETLTGFKYIGEQIKIFEKERTLEYLFGFEESYGCLAGTHSRDKDAVAAAMLVCEAAAYYKSMGLTLWDQMRRLYERYGFYKEELATVTFHGREGAGRIAAIMEQIREHPPAAMGGYSIRRVTDYRRGFETAFPERSTAKTTLPKSNVLYFDLDGGAWFCIRPSGTEPKIKFYSGVKADSLESAAAQSAGLMNSLIAFVKGTES